MRLEVDVQNIYAVFEVHVVHDDVGSLCSTVSPAVTTRCTGTVSENATEIR